MKKKLDFLFSIMLMLCATLIIAVIPTEKDAAIYGDTLRLHILASSDSEADQSLKYDIRNKILDKYGELLKETGSIEAAEEKAAALTDEIEADVNAWIAAAGYNYGCEVTLGTEWYSTRRYEGFTLPKGYYTSLCVRLGKAEGQNWWCVMYPPLCLDIAVESQPSDDALVGYTKEECTLITSDGYNVKFKILELLSDAFSKNS